MVPLQFGVPGGPELLIVLLIAVISVLIPVALAYYIYTDPEQRGSDNGALWAVVAALACLVATPIGGLAVLFGSMMERG